MLMDYKTMESLLQHKIKAIYIYIYIIPLRKCYYKVKIALIESYYMVKIALSTSYYILKIALITKAIKCYDSNVYMLYLLTLL